MFSVYTEYFVQDSGSILSIEGALSNVGTPARASTAPSSAKTGAFQSQDPNTFTRLRSGESLAVDTPSHRPRTPSRANPSGFARQRYYSSSSNIAGNETQEANVGLVNNVVSKSSYVVMFFRCIDLPSALLIMSTCILLILVS